MDSSILTITALFAGFLGSQLLSYYREFEKKRSDLLAESLTKMEKEFSEKVSKVRTDFENNISKVKMDLFEILRDKMGKSATEKGTYSTFGTMTEEGTLDAFIGNFVDENQEQKDRKREALNAFIQDLERRHRNSTVEDPTENHRC